MREKWQKKSPESLKQGDPSCASFPKINRSQTNWLKAHSRQSQGFLKSGALPSARFATANSSRRTDQIIAAHGGLATKSTMSTDQRQRQQR